LRFGIGYFPLQKIDGGGAHRSRRNEDDAGIKKFSRTTSPEEYRLVRSGQAGPAGRTGWLDQNVAPALTM
jgi:hypothetical protein